MMLWLEARAALAETGEGRGASNPRPPGQGETR